MELGFETIGNACIIFHDEKPVLVTDPWLRGAAYFGSWILSHEVPAEQLETIQACEFIWISHGHPDHLSPESLELLRGKPILIGDHYGGRIAAGLREDGFEVRVLETGKWTRISPRIRIQCVPDYSQDSVLLVDLDGRLVVDANDASDRGVGAVLNDTVAGYERSFMLCLTGYGDADMINFFDEAGRRVLPKAAERRPVGAGVAEILDFYGLKAFVPSSSMHKYARTDSAWANEYRTEAEEHALGFDPTIGEILPAFIRYDLLREDFTRIDPPETDDTLRTPEECGDSWSDELTAEDVQKLEHYFRRVQHLRHTLGFLRFRVGGREHTLDIEPERFDRGITFEVPRSSLMTSVEYSIFDDLLIGNFMKTTLHGSWSKAGAEALYPEFTPYVTKFGDNGGAYTPEELRAYFRFYRERGSFGPGPSEATQASWRSIERYF